MNIDPKTSLIRFILSDRVIRTCPLLVFCSLVHLSCSDPGLLERRAITGPVIRVCLGDPLATQTFTIGRKTVFETEHVKTLIPDSSAVFVSLDQGGALLVQIGAGKATRIDGSCRFYPLSHNAGAYVHGRQYADTLLVSTAGARIYLVNILPLETYLLGVVPNEIGRNRKEKELEAVKAQSILARTYALAKIRLPLTRLFDVYADTRDQVYSGTEPPVSLASTAVRTTAGEVLEYDGRLAECYFHATCGGSTEAVSYVWHRPQSKPYLAGIRDRDKDGEYCRHSPSFHWKESYTREEFESTLRRFLSTALDTASLKLVPRLKWALLDLKVLKRMPSGRVAQIKLVLGDRVSNSSVVLEGDKIRWAIRKGTGHSILKSSLFDVVLDRDSQQWIRNLRFEGRGQGHGIGLCQWGAIERARQGQNTRQILRAYFPGTDIARRY